MYIRFGEIPEGERSGVYHAGELVGKEDGVSVYDAKIDDWGNVSVCLPLPINANTLDTFRNLRGLELHDVLQYGEEGTFGQAIGSLKHGFKVARKGWNGKGMWLWLKQETMVKSEWCHDMALKAIADQNGGEIHALGTICMKTADNKILTGWLASQTDMLSEDWVLVNPNE